MAFVRLSFQLLVVYSLKSQDVLIKTTHVMETCFATEVDYRRNVDNLFYYNLFHVAETTKHDQRQSIKHV